MASSGQHPVPPPPDRKPYRFRALAPAARTVRLWIWATVAGALAAASTVGFRWAIQQVEWIATSHSGGLVAAARSLTPWHRALVCTVGGVLAGLVLQWGGRWARKGPLGDQHLDYIDAARAGHVELNDRTTLTRTVSALLSVGTGASIGREGPMVQLAAWLSA
ncbi:MAG: Cl-channel voltage-gated family protein [Variovorax sp.]|nr:Cl-channel voltage-gated family protein [Variovorax sp.]